MDYGFTVTETGIASKVANVGSNDAAFIVADNTDMTIMALLLAINNLTGNLGHDWVIFNFDEDEAVDLSDEELANLIDILFGS